MGPSPTKADRGKKKMGTINIVKNIKEIHPECVVIVKIGTFYNVYGKDA